VNVQETDLRYQCIWWY